MNIGVIRGEHLIFNNHIDCSSLGKMISRALSILFLTISLFLGVNIPEIYPFLLGSLSTVSRPCSDHV